MWAREGPPPVVGGCLCTRPQLLHHSVVGVGGGAEVEVGEQCDALAVELVGGGEGWEGGVVWGGVGGVLGRGARKMCG